MRKTIFFTGILLLISAVSFGHWYVFYEFPKFDRWTVWYLGFSLFLLPVVLFNKRVIHLGSFRRCLFVFMLLIVGQSVADVLLIFWLGGNFPKDYNFFLFMSNSWGANLLLSLVPFFGGNKKSKDINNDEILDEIDLTNK